MTTKKHKPVPTDPVPEEMIPLTISVAAEHMEHVERLARRTGRTADQLLEDFVVNKLGPLGVLPTHVGDAARRFVT